MAHATPIVTNPPATGLDLSLLAGVSLVVIFPALFWTGVAFLLCASIGITLSLFAAGSIALGIAAFLGVIFRALRSNSDT